MLPFSPKPADDQAEYFLDVIKMTRQTSNTKQNQVEFWHLLPFCSQRLLGGKVSCLKGGSTIKWDLNIAKIGQNQSY
uniref:Expressed protein n=1 Tax=Echinococcus granulosus TaxID=6210 RepID=A0A068WRH6_ECHGR|nr:expressed protein [Echinococcus granulosus]